MDFREYSKTHRILMDGAMGTYYAAKYNGEVCEYANLEHPDRIKKIHHEYMQAGANLIFTNTFAANETSLNLEKGRIEQIIRSGIAIAKDALQEYGHGRQPVFLAGDIGRIPDYSEKTEEEVFEEYCRICDIFLEEELPVLVFETFSELTYVKKLIPYIRKKNQTVFVIVSLCLNKNGYTSSGMSGSRLLGELAAMEGVDACGANCGIGSGHMYQLMQEMQKLFPQKYFMAEPNAGYPEQFQNRMVFMDNAEYFANNMKKIAELGVRFLGGCCGTTPEYIALLAKKIDVSAIPVQQRVEVLEKQPSAAEKPKKQNSFYEKLRARKRVIAVEVDPPYHAEYEKVMECAWKLKQENVDIITMADSPMGRSRVDSILMSVKIANETGMSMMPHLCCRDRNIIAIRSAILGAYINKIRNMLIVTGDPVPSVSRNMTTGVFDYHSIKLMKFLKEMNEEHFADDPICYGGALNQGRGNLDNIIKRMQEKIDAGASYFLTQPIYSDEEIERIRQIKERVDTKILCGIMPLISYRNANFMKHEVTSIHVPDEIIAQYSPDMSKEEGEWTGARIANEIIEKVAPFADGYYIMLPFNRVSLMDKLSLR
ncbi:MAG: bifunctional homocysteine S-methyltransferase/methylenetetrahydrofolate reductase [bacterium]|nr:bifunctional homocysteine S-methyltransferase/methylenetetrahydrofolate reductase [bacterium]